MQVWQTWRVDQTMWNCVARYHPTALDAITKNDPSTRAPEEYHTSEARALCIVYAINKLVPELVPSAVDLVSAWLVELGLDASIMTDDDAQDAAMVRVSCENHQKDELNDKAPCYYPIMGTGVCSVAIFGHQ